ncbi:MAG: sugar MFS transporter [Bacteroidetes bacterium]|nr:sugar MFS transporter [Fibrella sp.]
MKAHPNAVDVGSLTGRQTTLSIFLIGALFFVFGFVTWVNAILIPYFKIACELTNFQSYFVAFAFYISYFVMSVPSSYLLKRVGFRQGMMIGFWVMAVGAFTFVPAALSRTYPIFLLGLFLIGIGLAILQTAANPYITVLGSKERAAQRISIMGICNKAAGILAPILFAAVILRATDTDLFSQLPGMTPAERSLALDLLVRRVIVPYAVIGCVLIGLGLLVRLSPLPEINTEHETAEVAAVNGAKTSVLQFPHLVMGAGAIFLHVGTQVVAIDTIIGYAGSMGITLLEAKVFPSYTLFATICGYVLGIIVIPKYVSQVTVFRFCTLLGLALTLLIVFAGGQVSFLGHQTDLSIWFVVLLGLANSLVWAGIWPLALDGLGRFTKVGAALLIMGLSGNAILPVVYGYVADQYGLQDGYWVLFPCYLYLAYYAFSGHRIRRWGVFSAKKSLAHDPHWQGNPTP